MTTKPRRGRPTKPPEQVKRAISIMLSPLHHDDLDARSAAEQISISKIIGRVYEQYRRENPVKKSC